MLYERGYDSYYYTSFANILGDGPFYRKHSKNMKLSFHPEIRSQSKHNKIRGWGTNDIAMFEVILKNLREKIDTNKPFVMSIATLDTRGREGFPCDHCIKKHEMKILDTVECDHMEILHIKNK